MRLLLCHHGGDVARDQAWVTSSGFVEFVDDICGDEEGSVVEL